MDPIAQLEKRLEYVNATRRERNTMALEVIARPGQFPYLLEVAFHRHDEIGSRACWIVEFVCKKDLGILQPYLDTFLAGLSDLREESSIRPMAKICELLCEAENRKKSAGPAPLHPEQKERLIEVCFDWLIGDHKVATKAYSMRCLYLLGRDIPWVRENLRAVLLQHIGSGSAAYKARAKQILEALEKSR